MARAGVQSGRGNELCRDCVPETLKSEMICQTRLTREGTILFFANGIIGGTNAIPRGKCNEEIILRSYF